MAWRMLRRKDFRTGLVNLAFRTDHGGTKHFSSGTFGKLAQFFHSDGPNGAANCTTLKHYTVRNFHAGVYMLAWSRKREEVAGLKAPKKEKRVRREIRTQPPVEATYVAPKLKIAVKSSPDKTIEIFDGMTLLDLSKRTGASISALQGILADLGKKVESEFDSISIDLAELVARDNDAIIDRIQKSTRELKQGPIGKNLSSTEKRKFLINTLLGLTDSKEVVYSTLDAWVAFEQDFPLASIKQALLALEKEEQWHRIVQVIKWMLSKGQGNTIRTYEQLVCALEKDNRAEEAHRIWQKKIAHDLHSVPWRFCHLMLAIYYRNNMLDRLVKLFKELEACGRQPPSKDIIRKVEDAYEMLGLLEDKKDLLYKYKDLYNKPSGNGRKKGREFKKAEKNQKAADGSKQHKLETSETLPVHSCPSDKELDVTS